MTRFLHGVKRERYAFSHLLLISVLNGNVWQNRTSSPKWFKNKLRNEKTQTCMDPSCRIATVYFGAGVERMRRDACWRCEPCEERPRSRSPLLLLLQARENAHRRAHAWHATERVRDYRLRHFLRPQHAGRYSVFFFCFFNYYYYFRLRNPYAIIIVNPRGLWINPVNNIVSASVLMPRATLLFWSVILNETVQSYWSYRNIPL